MDIVKINLKTPVYGLRELNIKEMTEVGDELLIKLRDRDCYNISVGQYLTLRRYIYTEGTDYFVINGYVEVLREDDDHTIHTTIPERAVIKVSSMNGKPDIYSNMGIVDNGGCISVGNITSSETSYDYDIIVCDENIDTFAQDLAAIGQSVEVMDAHFNSLGTFGAIGIPFGYRSELVKMDDCIEEMEEIETCNKTFGKYYKYLYNFCPSSFSRNKIAVTGLTDVARNEAAFIRLEFNPFYYYTSESSENGDVVRKCSLYGDVWWSKIENDIREEDKEYINSGNTRSMIGRDASFFSVGVPMGAAADETLLGNDDDFGNGYVKTVEESLIPDVIDMERIKIPPYIDSNGILSIATSITMDFHFRQRVKNNGGNTNATANYPYADGWYIDKENDPTTWWNGMAYNGSEFSSGQFNDFINKCGRKSDLLRFLNFIDNDVYYRKKKVSKSFVRLSFYTSKDAIEQRLLYYSTIFLDATALSGKYIRQLSHMEDNGLYTGSSTDVVGYDSSAVSARVDSEITITNEYDTERSSEGFNIYLFNDDFKGENVGRTIYMKAEFNHAGNGKSIPMILWPRDNEGHYVPLTIDNFIDSLYIPISITYADGKYVYSIPSAENDEKGNIRLMLFEPKLEMEKND